LCSPEKAFGGTAPDDTRRLAHRILFAVANVHGGSDLWGDMRRDPEAFERAVLFVLNGERANLTTADDLRRITWDLRNVAERLGHEQGEHYKANVLLIVNGLLHDIAESLRCDYVRPERG
jgi:hypothetical protein